jgi:hypothetical protein
MKDLKKSVFIACCCMLLPMLFPVFASGQSAPSAAEEEAIAMINQIYTEVSSEGDRQVDWDRVRSFFAEEALIILRTSREGSTRFTVEGFIRDFQDFYESPAMKESGFKEEILRLKSEVYHDIAFIAVVYEASILKSERPPQKGIDFWLLTRTDSGWKVAAVTNEIIPPGEEIPAMFGD